MVDPEIAEKIKNLSDKEMFELGYMRFTSFVETAANLYKVIYDWSNEVVKNAEASKNSIVIVFTKKSLSTLQDKIATWKKNIHA